MARHPSPSRACTPWRSGYAWPGSGRLLARLNHARDLDSDAPGADSRLGGTDVCQPDRRLPRRRQRADTADLRRALLLSWADTGPRRDPDLVVHRRERRALRGFDRPFVLAARRAAGISLSHAHLSTP